MTKLIKKQKAEAMSKRLKQCQCTVPCAAVNVKDDMRVRKYLSLQQMPLQHMVVAHLETPWTTLTLR
jgi:hypothetical protein